MITQTPFEVEESGWGEFETQVTIFFADPNEKPVFFKHLFFKEKKFYIDFR